MKNLWGMNGAVLLAGAAMAAASPLGAKEAVTPISIAAPPAGKGQIVFFRTGGSGFALGCQVNQNDQRVSALGAGKYFTHVAAPGPQTFVVSSEAKDVLNLEVEPDETQYVRCKIKMGIMVGRPNLEPSTKAEFDKASHKLKPVDADDMGPKAG
ncbi:hypothetical protein [Blastomonas sp.]|uniref:hypothetical protein n=1 Tax=Blastomonas sp. TaxID=1909299 RepID=UPI0035932B22